MEKKNTRGGKREGAGRPKKSPTMVYPIQINKKLAGIVKAKYNSKVINPKLRFIFEFLANLELELNEELDKELNNEIQDFLNHLLIKNRIEKLV